MSKFKDLLGLNPNWTYKLELKNDMKEKYSEFNPGRNLDIISANGRFNTVYMSNSVGRDFTLNDALGLYLTINDWDPIKISTNGRLNHSFSSLGFNFVKEKTYDIYATWYGIKSNIIQITQEANYIDKICFMNGNTFWLQWESLENSETSGKIRTNSNNYWRRVYVGMKSSTNAYDYTSIQSPDGITIEYPVIKDDVYSEKINITFSEVIGKIDIDLYEYCTFDHNHEELEVNRYDISDLPVNITPNDTNQNRKYPGTAVATVYCDVTSDKPEYQPNIRIELVKNITLGTQQG